MKNTTNEITLDCGEKAPTMEATLSEIYAAPLPPEMPRQLPKLVKLLLGNTPDIYKPTVAHAIFPPLAAHMQETTFMYTDNTPHEATLMNIVMAPSGTGKGCIDEPINRIMADIRRRDFENSKRLNDWNASNNRRGDNERKAERPEGLVIQEIDADVTHAAFVQRLDEAEKRFLYYKLNEIELFDKLRGSGGQQFVIMCQSFDYGNRYGQTRAGSQSVNVKVCIRFNWNASGTIQAVKRYFARQLTKGPISRINFCTIPQRRIGDKQPKYGIYDEGFDRKLAPYIEQLTTTHGMVNCTQAHRLASRLIEECAEFSALSQDRVFENLSFRANIIAWLKACVLYVANGQRWERSIEDFVRWSLHYDLWCKMRFFADDIRNEEEKTETTTRRGPQSLLDMLPDEFTMDDAKAVRQKCGKSNDGFACNKMINTWLNRKHIIQYTVYSFKKAQKQ